MYFNHIFDTLRGRSYERVHGGEVNEELLCEHSPGNETSKCCEKEALRVQQNGALESSNRMVFVVLATLLVSNAFVALAYFLKAPSNTQCVQNVSLWCKASTLYFPPPKQADPSKHQSTRLWNTRSSISTTAALTIRSTVGRHLRNWKKRGNGFGSVS